MTDIPEPVYDRFAVCSWQVGSEEKIRFPVELITDTKRNRIVAHERPYREGAKLDDTGGAPREFALTCCFSNEIDEPGLENNSEPLFPEMLRRLQDSFDVHETGSLELPTIGVVRCRAVSCIRTDQPDNLDAPTVSLVFHVDNEDALDRALVTAPTVKGSLRRVAEQTVFSAQADGGWDDALASLQAAVDDLDDALNAPGRAANQVAAIARSNRRLLGRVHDQQTRLAREASRPFTDPVGSFTERQLVILRDLHAQAASERARSLPAVRAFKVDVPETSIFEIAARFGQDATDLLDLNDDTVADPLFLRAGQTVRVFERPAQ